MRLAFLPAAFLCLLASWGTAEAPAPATRLIAGLDDCVPAHAGREICRTCHPGGRLAGAQPYGKCADCHLSPHGPELRDRPDGGACDACHDVAGFETVRFGIAEHRDTEFPLEGAHRAVSCPACHKREVSDGAQTVRLDLRARQCGECHQPPNPGHVAEIQERYACRDCHAVQSWRVIGFDHGRAEFKLSGKHARLECRRCHATFAAGTPAERVRYREIGRNCADCHTDVHARQFAGKACADCHTTENWTPTRFDHQRDATFALTGKHREANCHACHRLEAGPGGRPIRRFKPLGGECRMCHADDGSVRSVFLPPAARERRPGSGRKDAPRSRPGKSLSPGAPAPERQETS